MRIAIVTTAGVTRQFRQWPEAVLGRALVSRGYHVTAFALREGGSDLTGSANEVVDGIGVKRFSINKFWFSPRLFINLAHFRPDVLHLFHLRNALNWQAMLYALFLRVPVVFTVVGPLHDPYLVDNRERPYEGKIHPDRLIFGPVRLFKEIVKAHFRRPLSKWQNFCMHFPLYRSNRLIALSRPEADLFKLLGISPNRIHLVPLWIDSDYIRAVPSGPSLADNYASPKVLFLGQLKERKGYDTLARAMPAVLNEMPRATFLFAGQNPARAGHLEEICRENGSIDRLVLLGQVSEEDKVRLMRTADCLVYPTRYESFGLPPLEAMAAGCPVIASDIPVVNGMITDGWNGVLVQPENPAALASAILRLVQDSELRQHLVEGGSQTVLTYNEKELAGQIEDIYREIAH